MTQRSSLHNVIQDVIMFWKSPIDMRPRDKIVRFFKYCLFVEIIIFGNKIITLLMKINCLVNCATLQFECY